MEAFGEQPLPWFAAQKASDTTDSTDIATLVTLHSALLYRVALSILRNPAEAEDVVQDTFLRVIERQRELSTILAIRPWLIRITWNLAIDRCRRTRPSQMDDLLAAGLVSSTLPADQALAESRRTQLVLTAIDRLPTHERQAILLSAIDDLTTTEIAAILHKSESSVRSLLFRARTHLRQRLKE
jgi:RNA polymerase sigma-70 factor (ECF subfamily)